MGTASEQDHDRADPGLDTVMSERRHLVNLTYRLVGSLAEAEGAVQETCARWYALSRQQQEALESPGAWLGKVASRICLDLLGSARARRENYVGQWRPEPLPDPSDGVCGGPGAGTDPADRVTLDESVSMAFLVVLEAMTPAERVAFILHDVFAYRFAEVADVLGRTPGACRELASSARRRVRSTQAATAPAAHQAGIVKDFKRLGSGGHRRPHRPARPRRRLDGRRRRLDPPNRGGEQVAHFLVDIARWRRANARLLERSVNGQPGLVAEVDGVALVVYAFEVAGDQIRRIWAIINPEKLRPWAAN